MNLQTNRIKWLLCHQLLLRGSPKNRIVTVSTFLANFKWAKKFRAKMIIWAEQNSQNMGGLTPGQIRSQTETDEFWPSLAVATRFKEAVRRNPAYAQRRLPAFTPQELNRELVHVRCHFCQELHDKLQLCTGCEKAKYCSRDCQQKHWVSKHRNECKAAAKGRS
ncbi:hypothetical protein COCSUDRAFT_43473 [Coccomyxa subellipsoidea C-169]|uniref:MYND-type domain-containing protein n=1 Tax=Coccomyxa subellipsoidea (strain C-169) TaxID=574566 RepID=I0YRV9_COCSC|nr:hypothetical protein COCSUDRAFT_43473 [Coccomyxa subellipsoidea C-169]EIE21128.1 hypothetical protein COCSUDRAFT_43473 [Coccomyxa subellipsoidea C-169]|eukprot:XP_005645672.1 hypothetical protein COCSUDRAFT_43473 [Coccomyxa subellipsoidea C-169]